MRKNEFEWLKLTDTSDTARVLYILMRKLSRKTGVCYAKVSTLATMMKKSRSQIQRLLRQLEEEKLIQGEIRKHSTTIYSFLTTNPQTTNQARYKEYLQSDEWKKLRKKKLKEAGNKCQLCNSGQNLHVHHRTYTNIYHEPLSDLIVLCNICHKRHHQK